jgi:hypothetical protein
MNSQAIVKPNSTPLERVYNVCDQAYNAAMNILTIERSVFQVLALAGDVYKCTTYSKMMLYGKAASGIVRVSLSALCMHGQDMRTKGLMGCQNLLMYTMLVVST